MVGMVLCQVEGMGVIARLPEDLDGCLHIKVDLSLTLCLPGTDHKSLRSTGD